MRRPLRGEAVNIPSRFCVLAAVVALALGAVIAPSFADMMGDANKEVEKAEAAVKAFDKTNDDIKLCPCDDKSLKPLVDAIYNAQVAQDELPADATDDKKTAAAKAVSDAETAYGEKLAPATHFLGDDPPAKFAKCYKTALDARLKARKTLQGIDQALLGRANGTFRQSPTGGEGSNTYLQALTKVRARLNDKKAPTAVKEACPPPTQGYTPYDGGNFYDTGGLLGAIPVTFYAPPVPGTADVSQDGTVVCTYGRGRPEQVSYTPYSPGGSYTPVPTPGGGTPPPGGTGGSTPAPTPTTTDNPPGGSTPNSPEPKAGTPPPENPPATTENPPPATTTDQPPVASTGDGDDTVETFDKDTIEQDGHTETGNPVDGQVVMLQTAKPSLAQGDDTGSGDDPKKCVTVNGHCAVTVRRGERAAYGLPDAGDQPGHFRLDLTSMKHTTGIAEITSKTRGDISTLQNALPAGATLAASIFAVGDRKFLRLEFATPANYSGDLLDTYSRLIGVDVHVDYCDEDKPGIDAQTVRGAAAALPSSSLVLVTSSRRSVR